METSKTVHISPITNFAFVKNGRDFITFARESMAMWLWKASATTGAMVLKIPHVLSHQSNGTSGAYAGNNVTVVSTGTGNVRFLSIEKKCCLAELPKDASPVTCLSCYDKFVCCGYANGSVKILYASFTNSGSFSVKTLCTVSCHDDAVIGLYCNGLTLVSLSGTEGLKVTTPNVPFIPKFQDSGFIEREYCESVDWTGFKRTKVIDPLDFGKTSVDNFYSLFSKFS